MKALSLSFAAITIAALMGCRGQTSRDAPIIGIRNMYDQPRYDMQSESEFFPDHRTMRPLVDGVISQEEEIAPEIATGRLEDQSGYVLEVPKDVEARFGGRAPMMNRGQARFNIYCAPCHDGTGNGQGMVRKHALATGAAAFAPTSFHQDRIRHMPDGQLFATITNGKSNMPPYGMQIPVDDRWAIVTYVRALQVAQPKMEVAQ
jgi:mono/diheme cytochrome c family protein